MRITCVHNTFHLGSLASVVESLEEQDFPEDQFELVIADELHRWRAPVVAARLAACQFRVRHLPVERSLFPVASTMRASNTALRAADGELVVHVCDGAVLPRDFLSAHWRNYQEDPKSIGVAPYRGRQVRASEWAHEPMGVWDTVEVAARGGSWFHDLAWTAWKNPLVGRFLDVFCEPVDYSAAFQGSPALGVAPRQHANEWFAHYKVDSVPRAAYLEVNGWDEDYDGGYIYADIDMTLRLMAVGYRTRVVDTEVHILDMHPVTLRTPDTAFRQGDMRAILEATRRGERPPHCVNGLSRPEFVPPAFEGWVSSDWPAREGAQKRIVRTMVFKPWLPHGRFDAILSPAYAIAWQWVVDGSVLVVNDDGEDRGCFAKTLGERAQVVRFTEFSDALAADYVVAVGVGADDDAGLFHRLVRCAGKRLVVVGKDAAGRDAFAGEAEHLGEHVHYYDADEVVPADAAIVMKGASSR